MAPIELLVTARACFLAVPTADPVLVPDAAIRVNPADVTKLVPLAADTPP